MTDYLLFIDTEASDLPKKWFLPYTAPGNWPHAVQIAWVIYDKEGIKIKEQDYFVNDNDFDISPSAFRIHGITKEFLQKYGMPRKELLAILLSDLAQYQPMISGHFLELDYHILGAEFNRTGITHHPMEGLPGFCIMTATKHLQQNPHYKYLRLGDLYELLFKKQLLRQHNALADAIATADCFFELVKRNEIKSFTQPPIVFEPNEKINQLVGWVIVSLLILLIVLLIFFYYG